MTQIVGHVDGIAEGALRGWLANLDDPTRLEHCILRDASGREHAFATHLRRSDVCAAIGQEGVFGFAIGLGQLRALGLGLAAFDRAGAPIPGGAAITLPPASPPATEPPGPPDIVLHLPKTAGTSIRNAILPSFPDSQTLLVYPHGAGGITGKAIRTMPRDQRAAFRLAYGHCSYGIHDALGVPVRYSMFIRHPAARLRSNLAHHRAAQTPPDGPVSHEFDNLTTRFASGVAAADKPPGSIGPADVTLALHNIRHHFAFIGLHAHLAEHFVEFCAMLGLPSRPLPHDNPTRPTPDPGIDWDQLYEQNRHDFALYEAIRAEGLVGRITPPAPPPPPPAPSSTACRSPPPPARADRRCSGRTGSRP